VEGTDYASPREVFSEVDRLEAQVVGCLGALDHGPPRQRMLVASLLADHERHRLERLGLRRRLRLGPAAARQLGPRGRSLKALREAQQALVFAHAEGMPALGDARVVDCMARHLVDQARHLTLIDLWLEGFGA